jgi:hypothetical protein
MHKAYRFPNGESIRAGTSRAVPCLPIMPRCYFNIREGDYTHVDDEGHECQSIEDMEREAAVTAASIARDHAARGTFIPVCVEVTQEPGRVLLIAKVDLEVERR